MGIVRGFYDTEGVKQLDCVKGFVILVIRYGDVMLLVLDTLNITYHAKWSHHLQDEISALRFSAVV